MGVVETGCVRSAIGVLVSSVSPRWFVVRRNASIDNSWSLSNSSEPNRVAVEKSDGRLKSGATSCIWLMNFAKWAPAARTRARGQDGRVRAPKRVCDAGRRRSAVDDRESREDVEPA